MPLPEITETQKSLSHILAYWFEPHEKYHTRLFKQKGYCAYCQALEDLEAYMGIHHDRSEKPD